MIELLIVIAVLGVLAVAVLSAINPIEQINRGRDTGSRSDAEQLLSGIDRYNAVQQLWPWQDVLTDPDAIAWQTADSVNDPSGDSMLDKLSAGGTEELKLGFIQRISDPAYNDLYMYYRGTPGDSTYVCFQPQSGSFNTDADARCCGTLPADFPAPACGVCGDTTDDYSCLP